MKKTMIALMMIGASGAGYAAADLASAVAAVPTVDDGATITFYVVDTFDTGTCDTTKSAGGYDQKANATSDGCVEKSVTVKLEKYGTMAADFTTTCKLKDGKVAADSCAPSLSEVQLTPETGKKITGVEAK